MVGKELNCPVCGEVNALENIYFCVGCRHIFRNYPKIDLHQYYSEDYREEKTNKELPDEKYDQRYSFILDKISPFLNDEDHFFEVGCGYGHFYRNLTRYNSSIAYHCCELSTPLAEQNNKKGIPTYNGDFTNLPVPEKKYDVVASFDVLEHIYDPKTYKNKVSEILKVGGYAVIQVPTDRGLHFKEEFDGHYHYFSKESLHTLFVPEFQNVLFYKTQPGETANGKEFLAVFRRIT